MIAPAVIAVDFDGTLVELGEPLRWRANAREFLLGAVRAGFRVWIHSCRCAVAEDGDDGESFWETGEVPPGLLHGWRLQEEMRGFLQREGLLPHVMLWTSPGKPQAEVYFDDRAQAPNWLVAAAELGVTLAHAEPGPTPPMGAAAGGIAASPAGAPAPAAAGPATAAAAGLRVQG